MSLPSIHSIPFPWQQDAWQLLQSLAKNNRLPHALLVNGPRGLGKHFFAEAWYAWLLCQQRDKNTHACGQCPSCHWRTAGNHPDVKLISPEGSGHRPTIKIDSIRELTTFLMTTPHQREGYKIVLFAHAEMMTAAAANALLKMLEEPLGKVVFILVTHQPNTLLPTLRSRCQRITFSTPAQIELKTWLKAMKISKEELINNIPLIQTAPLCALDKKYPLNVPTVIAISEQLCAIMDGKIDLVASIETWLKKMSLDDILAIIYLWLSDIARLQIYVKEAESALLQPQLAQMLMRYAQKLSAIRVHHYLDRCMELRRWQANQININAALTLESLLSQWKTQITQ